jgi:hypothetical protein
VERVGQFPVPQNLDSPSAVIDQASRDQGITIDGLASFENTELTKIDRLGLDSMLNTPKPEPALHRHPVNEGVLTTLKPGWDTASSASILPLRAFARGLATTRAVAAAKTASVLARTRRGVEIAEIQRHDFTPDSSASCTRTR